MNGTNLYSPTGLQGREKRVVVVDDSSTIRRLIVGFFREMGYRQFHECENGAEAFHLVQHLHEVKEIIDCITLDQVMEPMDGIGFLYTCQAQSIPLPPTIMITGENDANVIKKAISYGAQAILLKPFTGQALNAAVARVTKMPRHAHPPKAPPAPPAIHPGHAQRHAASGPQHHIAHPHPHPHHLGARKT